MPELIVESLAGGLADRISDKLKRNDQLIVCDNLDLDKAVLGVVSPIQGIGMPFANPATSARDREGRVIVNYHPTFLFRVKPQSFLFREYKYIVIADQYMHGIKPQTSYGDTGYYFISDEMPLGVLQVIEDFDKLFIINRGMPKVLVQDELTGSFVVRNMGMSVDASGITISAGGTGSMQAGKYSYLFVPVDKNGVAFPFDASVKLDINFTGDRTVTVSNLRNIRENITNRGFSFGNNLYVYRSKVATAATQFGYPHRLHSVLTWDDNSWQDNWQDNKTDDELTVTYDNDGGMPPSDLRGAVIFNNRMFGFCENSNILKFSMEYHYEVWSEYNQIPIGDSDPIRAMAIRGNSLVIFKDGAVYEFFGDSQFNYQYVQVSSMHGTNRKETVQSIDENKVIFVDNNSRVWLYDGNFVEISLPIKINGNNFKSAVVGRYYLLWANSVWGLPVYEPVVTGDDPGGDRPPDPPPPPEPPNDAPRPDWYPSVGTSPASPHNIPVQHDMLADLDVENVWSPVYGNQGYTNQFIFDNCYGFHVPSGKWTRFTDFGATVVEQPSRGGENYVVWYNGSQFVVFGNDYYIDFRPRVVLQSKFFFSDDYQEKRFRDFEMEIYCPYQRNLSAWMIGQIDIYIDGNIYSPAFGFPVYYASGIGGQYRFRLRFPRPILCKNISVKFTGNNWSNMFEIRDIRMHYEYRGTPIRE